MRLTLRIFALLDALSLTFMGMQLWYIAGNFQALSDRPSEKIQAVLLFPMFVLVMAGAIGLFLYKKWAFFLYYVQFPFRLYLWVFTLGFITLLPEAFNDYEGKWFEPLLKVCFAAEFIRLFLSIRMHRMRNRE